MPQAVQHVVANVAVKLTHFGGHGVRTPCMSLLEVLQQQGAIHTKMTVLVVRDNSDTIYIMVNVVNIDDEFCGGEKEIKVSENQNQT